MNLIVTCEHAGNQVPDGYSHIFAGHEEALKSHRGWDPGALEVARFLAAEFSAPLFSCETTRLLVETNRSLTNHQLFSEYSAQLDATQRELLLETYYHPYRNSVEEVISKIAKPVLHLSMHTFTPILNNTIRSVDVGILFDPDRKSESDFCKKLGDGLEQELSLLMTKFNEPYNGTDDGFTTYLRSKFEDHAYLGIEIEINQKYIGTEKWEMISVGLKEVLFDILYDAR
jgi:predicted N-formylglutamate amidohydrolase